MCPRWSREEFEGKVRALLESRYHHRHPFHVAMHEGKLSREKVQDWVANYTRFCAERPWPEGGAASLTQPAAPELMQTRMNAFLPQYGTAAEDMAYFSRHAKVAARESDQALQLVLGAIRSREDEERAI